MVARVLFPFVGDSVGGSHISSLLLITNLDPARYEPLVVLQQTGPLSEHLDRSGVPYQTFKLPELAGQVASVTRIVRAQIKSLLKTRAYFHEQHIDIVHTNDLRMHLTWPVAARTRKIPSVWHQRVLLSRSRLWRAMPLVASSVICISDAVRQTLPPMRDIPVDVVHNPVDPVARDTLANTRQELREQFQIPTAAPLIGFVGNMTPQKRPLAFISASAEIVRITEQPVHFLIFGDDRGGLRAATEDRAATLGIADRVHFAGHRSPIEPWIGALDLLLAPGVGDGFGRTLIEAMIAGTAVVAVASGGHGEIIDHGVTGLLVARDDRIVLAQAAKQLLDNTDYRRALSQRAQQYAKTHFGVEQHAQKVMGTYDEMLWLRTNRSTHEIAL